MAQIIPGPLQNCHLLKNACEKSMIIDNQKLKVIDNHRIVLAWNDIRTYIY